MKTNELKNAKAITLIALIVSIIVLLILAGVSIAVLTGENGILNRANSAKQTHEEKTEEEKLKLGVLALATEYRSQTTHTHSKFSEFVESKKSELENEIGAPDNSIEVDATKGTLMYKNKKYTLDTLGGIYEYISKWKLVADSNSNGVADLGDEITIGSEHFYVIKKDGVIITLLSKYNLKNPPTDESEADILKQYNGNRDTTEMCFSRDIYWSDELNSGEKINLNTWETTYNKTMPSVGDNAETITNNAILRARQYATVIADTLATTGVKGRLLTYEEANVELDTCLFGIDKISTNILYGLWTDSKEKVGGLSGNGYLNYWLASTAGNGWGGNIVCDIRGSEASCMKGHFGGTYYGAGVRPVIEVLESAIQ